MRKINIVIFVVGIIFVIGGITLSFFTNISDANSHTNVNGKDDKTMTQEEIDSIYNRYRNKSKNLVKEHCLDNLCISGMEMVFEKDGFGVVSANMYNNSNSVIPASYINLNFDVDGEVVKLHFFHSDIQVGANMDLEVHFTDNLLMKATDYKLAYPNEEEVLRYSQS